MSATQRLTHDTTGWCDRSEHQTCTGVLLAATGHHWWCACACHPEPPPTPPNGLNSADHELALATWRKARQNPR